MEGCRDYIDPRLLDIRNVDQFTKDNASPVYKSRYDQDCRGCGRSSQDTVTETASAEQSGVVGNRDLLYASHAFAKH